MAQEEIEARLCAMLTRILHEAESDHAVTPDTDIVSELALESIQIMEFVTDVEDSYDLAIDLDSLAAVRTVRDMAHLVARLR